MKRHVPYAPKMDKPLTKRQVEVLVGIHFGEVQLIMSRSLPNTANSFHFPTWNFFAVNVASVVNILKRRKMIRAIYDKSHFENNMAGAFCYLLPTDRGLTEIAKHSDMWQVPGDD